MKQTLFNELLKECLTAKPNTPVWACGYAFLDLTEKQVEKLRVAVQVNPYCKILENENVMLPNGIILRKLTRRYRLDVNDQFHHRFDAWDDFEAFNYMRKKSKLYGDQQVTLYGYNGKDVILLGECYNGYGFLYRKEGRAPQ